MTNSSQRTPLLGNKPPSECTNGSGVPSDRCYLVYLIFYILGVGSLLPWNFFSNAREYFMYKLRSDTNVTAEHWQDDPSKHNHFQRMFVPYLAMAAMIPNVLFMFLNTAVTKIMPLRMRIVIATVSMIAMFALTIVLTKINTDAWETHFFVVTMVTIVIMNAGSAVLQGGVFGLSGMFPKEYTQSVMGGMGMGGVIAAVANILTIWLSSGPVDSGFGYFMTAEIVVIAALVGYLCLPCLNFARHYIEDDRSTERSTRSTRVNTDSSEEIEFVPASRGSSTSMLKVFKQIRVCAVGVFIIFTVTLSCYPAINSQIYSVNKGNHSQWAENYFIPVTCFLLFNTFDLLGRSLAGVLPYPREGSTWLPIFCMLRIGFVPIFMLCNILPRHHLPTVFKNDYVPIITMVFFGASNGHLSTLCMMYGPRLVAPEDMQMAGAMMSFFLALGLGTGAGLSFLLVTLA